MAILVKPQKTWMLHIAFWCVYASFFFYLITYRRGELQTDWDRIILDLGFHVTSMIFIAYLNYFFFFPRFLKHRNILRYMVEFLPLLLGYGYLVVQGKILIFESIGDAPRFLYSSKFYINHILNTLFLVVFIGLLKFVEDWFELEATRQEVENERLTSELRFLKTQIHPHFLFNTLNNIYYLAYTNSPNTAEVVAKLSQMMRYMIHESNHLKVPLEKEIEFIENYIDLEKLRLDESVPIDFQVEGNLDGKVIAPLILITFLENAFKHGVSSSTKNTWIKASIKVEGDSLLYQVSNSKIQQSNKTFTEASGIGLKNVRRRLELSYPDNYELQIDDTETKFVVQLKLNML